MVMETSLRLRGADSTDVQPPRAADSTAGQRPRGRGANSTASQRSRGADSTAGQLGLRIHAKQKLPLAPNALLQAHAEIDTSTGKPSHLALLARHFFPELSANVGAGVQHENGKIFRYCIRGKKAVSFTSDALLGLNIKGRLLADKDFKPRTMSGAIELAWTILDFRKGQDVRLKAGYELYRKMPYFQLRENNWTLNGYMDGKWDIRFDM
uniref:Uncharacterized protein n=1 Tax=Avena sativa TaxID=4498 RepID=A0ACD5X0V9_AVESA